MQLNNNKILTSLVFLVNPLISTPFVFIELINKKKYAIGLLAVFFGILGYITIPLDTDDLIRHYADFLDISRLSTSQFFSELWLSNDYAFKLLQYSLARLGLSKQFLPFVCVSIVYYIKLSILYSVVTKVKEVDRRVYIYLLLIFILGVNFRASVLSMRNSVAIHLFLYGVYNWFIEEKSIKGYTYLFLAAVTHFMTLVYLPFLIIAHIPLVKKYIKYVFYFSFIFYFINTNLITSLLGYWVDQTGIISANYAEAYIDGFWATDFVDSTSFKGKIFMQIANLPYYFTLFYLLIFKKKITSKTDVLLYVSATWCNLLFVLPNLFGRYSSLPTLLFLIVFVIDMPKLRYRYWRNLLYSLFLISLLYSFSQMYSMRQTIAESYPKMIYETLPTVFFNEIQPSDYIPK